jgi:hypothetical protein
MGYVFLAGIVVVAALAAYQSISRLRKSTRLKLLRWTLSGVAALLTVFLALARRFELAAFTGLAAVSVFRRGRLGPFTLGSESVSPGNISKVRSHYVAMELDHDSNEISGSVIAGQFAGADLIDLDETDTRALIAEIGGDPESLSLLESWLDANRAGWREYSSKRMRLVMRLSSVNMPRPRPMPFWGLSLARAPTMYGRPIASL